MGEVGNLLILDVYYGAEWASLVQRCHQTVKTGHWLACSVLVPEERALILRTITVGSI